MPSRTELQPYDQEAAQKLFSSIENIYVATTRGPCPGVKDAIQILDEAVTTAKSLRPEIPVVCLHEEGVVHNTEVVEYFKERGVQHIEDPKEVSPGSVVVITAHGREWWVPQILEQNGCHVIDTTCPLVTGLQIKVREDVRKGRDIVLWGQPTHPEARGVASYVPDGRITIIESLEDAQTVDLSENSQLAFHTQTTAAGFEADKAKKFLLQSNPNMITTLRGDECNAVRDRQEAVYEFPEDTNLAVIVGSPTSKNTKSMALVADEDRGIPTTLRVDYAHEIDIPFLAQTLHAPVNVALSSGASVLDVQFLRVRDWFLEQSRMYGREPNVVNLPPVSEEREHFKKEDDFVEIQNKLKDWLLAH
ncbi:hypothetical protein HY405_00250 [Candidatus Microgenomates bacterium]|nr:hypothetical protein [Candidatus Microgenomates bacterium]